MHRARRPGLPAPLRREGGKEGGRERRTARDCIRKTCSFMIWSVLVRACVCVRAFVCVCVHYQFWLKINLTNKEKNEGN